MLASALTLAVSSALSLLLLEHAVRVAFPVYDPSGMLEFRRDADGTPLGAPNTTGRQWKASNDYDVQVRFNQYGLRDGKDLRHAAAGDLFVVGDSFSFGHGVAEDKRYSSLLDSALDAAVYNISIPTDFDGYAKLVGYAQRLGGGARNLILGVCMENDLKHYELGERHYRNDMNRAVFALKVYMKKSSALYNALVHSVYSAPALKEAALRLNVINGHDRSADKNQFSAAVIASSVGRLERLREAYGINYMLVVIIPSRALWVGDNKETELRVHRGFVSALRAEGFEVVDLLPAFTQDADPLRYHFAIDGHWNESGHRQAAITIARAIARDGSRRARAAPTAMAPHYPTNPAATGAAAD